jgi:uncharacterized membrane-anchored protein
MSSYRKLLVSVACGLALTGSLFGSESPAAKPKLNILKGPAKAQLGNVAQIEVPVGYSFLDGAGTRAIMKASGEPVSGHELGFLRPTNAHWSVLFEFADVGYVKDDEKDKLDADKLLASIKRGTAESNKERERMGNPPLEVVGWEVPPRYDATTHNLEWAIRATSEGRPILNYNTRLLGRKGVMEVVLIVEPDALTETLPTFKGLLGGYAFQSGNTYAEFRQGDAVAKYGLAALVVGGAAVGAAKLGLFAGLLVFLKKGWKLVVVALAAAAAAIKRFVARLFTRRDETIPRE